MLGRANAEKFEKFMESLIAAWEARSDERIIAAVGSASSRSEPMLGELTAGAPRARKFLPAWLCFLKPIEEAFFLGAQS